MVNRVRFLKRGCAPTSFIATLAAVAALMAPPAARAQGELPPGLLCLKEAYPEHICGVEPNALIWCDGTKMAYDDGVVKGSFDALLASASLKDQMSIPYPLGRAYPTPGLNVDPGRVRHEGFFRKMYGADARQVGLKTAKISWMAKDGGKRLRVTTVNGVDKRLEAVSAALSKLEPKLRAIASSTSGTFVWRPIGGTKRLSMHSFAIAVDVGVPRSDFWGWVKPEADGTYTYRNRFPLEIVEVFEAHGFIWGGKWYHFDTMHFEYRPELICLARKQANANKRSP